MIRLTGSAVLALALAVLTSASRADPIIYLAPLDGPSEAPPNDSPGTGFARVTFDLMAHTMRVQATFADLIAGTTAAHIHAPTAVPGQGTALVATQVPSFIGFPLGVTSGTYDMTFDTLDAATYRPGFITANGGTPAGAEAALAASLDAGTAYFNIHSTAFPGGEIRGFLQVIPEPASLVLLGTGALGLLVWTRRWTARARA